MLAGVCAVLQVVFFYAIILLIVAKVIQVLTLGKCRSYVCLSGKTAIVTGGNSGIGYQTVLNLASRGCRVIIADVIDATETAKRITELTSNSGVIPMHLDLASLASVRKFAQNIITTEDRLDILINNAGVPTAGNKHTSDGLDPTMQINYFGHFLLTHLLIDLLKKSAPSRIVFVSSSMAFVNNLSLNNLNYPENFNISLFSFPYVYGNSKLCLILAAKGFTDRLKGTGVTCNALYPGAVKTGIFKEIYKVYEPMSIIRNVFFTLLYFYGKSPEEGAQTTLHLAISKETEQTSGKYFWDCKPFYLPSKVKRYFGEAIWKKSEELVGLREEEKLKIS